MADLDSVQCALFVAGFLFTYLGRVPVCLKNAYFTLILHSLSFVDQLLSTVTFAPGLLDVLTSTSPPSVSYFKGLPMDEHSKQWAVYILLLEKPGSRPRVQVGSATEYATGQGLRLRMRQYREKILLPILVEKALREGFVIARIGMLCWTPLPPYYTFVALRALFVAMEGAFTMAFWTFYSRTADYGLPPFCFWPIDSLEYDGCGTHCPLKEPFKGQEYYATPEVIALKLANRAHNQKQSRLKTKTAGTFSCGLCNLNCVDNYELQKHLRTQKHKDMAAGIVKPTPRSAVRQALNVAAKRYYCKLCDHAFKTQQKLDTHLATPKHGKRAAALESAGSAAETTTPVVVSSRAPSST